MTSVSTVNSKSYEYNTPKLLYTAEQIEQLGLQEDRFHKDPSVPGGINNSFFGMSLVDWKNDWNPNENGLIFESEKKNRSLFSDYIHNLNGTKAISRGALLSFIAEGEILAKGIYDAVHNNDLTQEGVINKKQKLVANFIDASVNKLLAVIKENNKEALKKLELATRPFDPAKTIEETLLDIEIRNAYRLDPDLRLKALMGSIPPSAEKAICRADAFISGFKDYDYGFLSCIAFFNQRVDLAYWLESVYAINNALFLAAYRSVKQNAKFAEFTPDVIENTIDSLRLNWVGNNLMSDADPVREFLVKASKESEEFKELKSSFGVFSDDYPPSSLRRSVP